MGYERIELAGLGQRPLRIAHSPLPSVLRLIGEALGLRRPEAPPEWRAAVRGALRRRDLAALLPVFGRDRIVFPSCLTPLPDDGSVADAVEQIASTDPDVLLAQAHEEFGDSPPLAWSRVERAPERWLPEFATAIDRAAGGFAPVWSRGRGLLDRETERVGAAAVRGAAREVLGGLHANGRILGDELVLARDGSDPARWSIPRDGLALVPMLAADSALVTWHDGDHITHIAYPVPGQQRLLAEPDPVPDPLAELLGARRATILRLLDEPATAGAIATALESVPSVASHHLAALEASGLVTRERRGQHVHVRRTSRGTALLALYD